MGTRYTPGAYRMNSIICGTCEPEDKTKSPYFFIQGQIEYQWVGDKWVTCQSADRTIKLYMSEAAFDRTADDLERLGFNKDFDNPVLAKAVDGLDVECWIETYEGKEFEKWGLPGVAKEQKKAGTDANRRFSAMYQNRIRNSAPPTPPPPPPVTAVVPTGEKTPF